MIHEHVLKLSTAIVHVFSDFGTVSWMPNCRMSTIYNLGRFTPFFKRELDIIDGDPVVFEWKVFPGHINAETPLRSPTHDGE